VIEKGRYLVNPQIHQYNELMPKIIIVSGGSDGLGKEIAKVLTGSNKVIILAHNEQKLKTVSEEIGCDYVLADVSRYDQVEKAINNVLDKYGHLDCLVNSAGIWAKGKITDNTFEEITEILDVNTKGTIFLCKAVLPQMEKQGGGEIINIISQDGLCAKKDRSLYHSSKWAITGFTKCLQLDYSEKNIKVTGVYPGLMRTTLFEKKGVQRDLTHSLNLVEVAKLVEYVINLSPDTHIPEIGIKNLLNTDKNMDDQGTGLDLNLDPDLITTQSGPQVAPPAQSIPKTEPVGIIDITPESAQPPQPSIQSPITLPSMPSSPDTSSSVTFPTTESPSELVSQPAQSQAPLPPLPPLQEVPSAFSSKPDEFIPKVVPSEPAAPPSPPSPAVLDPQEIATPQDQSNFSIDSSSALFENPEDVKVSK